MINTILNRMVKPSCKLLPINDMFKLFFNVHYATAWKFWHNFQLILSYTALTYYFSAQVTLHLLVEITSLWIFCNLRWELIVALYCFQVHCILTILHGIQAYSTVGTPDYIAPEVLLKKGYGMECDWSVKDLLICVFIRLPSITNCLLKFS